MNDASVNKKTRRVAALGCWAVALALTGSAAPAEDMPFLRWEGHTMGSVYTVQIVGTNLSAAQIDPLITEVDQRLQGINRQMSHYLPDSELSRFNRAPANAPFKVSPEFARVVRFSVELSRRSQGAFDPTLGSIINLWGFGEATEQRTVPPAADLESARRQTGWRHLSVTPQDELIKDLPGLALNLSAVAKGFGVDEMMRLLQGHGLTNIYVSIAGEVRVLGHNPRGTNWQVGISAPVDYWRETDSVAGVASLSNQAISTSGDYQKFFRDPQGRRLSHLIDPRTGWPVQHALGGVSVVGPDSMTADALGTTLFVLGVKEGLPFIESWTNAAALFIVREADGKFRPIPSAAWKRMTGGSP